MAATSQYKYLDPEALGRLKNLTLAARLVVEGFFAGMHKSPHKNPKERNNEKETPKTPNGEVCLVLFLAGFLSSFRTFMFS